MKYTEKESYVKKETKKYIASGMPVHFAEKAAIEDFEKLSKFENELENAKLPDGISAISLIDYDD